MTASSVAGQVITSIVTLEKSLATDLASAPAASALVFDQLDVNGLGGRVAALFDAAASGSPNGSISPPALALLFQAVEGEISGSLQQTEGNLYLSATTPGAGTSGTATLSTLTAPTGSSVPTQVEYGIVALEQTLASELTLTPTASSLVFDQLDANGLGTRMAELFTAATSGTTDGSVLQPALSLLYTSVDAEIAASLQQTAGDVALDIAGQSGGSSINLTTLGTQIDTAYATLATLVRKAELTLTTSTGPGGGGGGGTMMAGLTVAGSDAVVGTTGSTTLTFTVSLSAASTTAVTVAYATADGSALAGTDYKATSGTLTFAPGVTSQTVDVTVFGETTTVADKTLNLNLTNASNATITSNAATGEILYATSTPSVSATPALANVGSSGTAPLTFTVSLSAVSATSITVNYATADGSALAGTDYTATSGTLTFAPGTTSETVTVTATGEPSTVSTRTLNLNLTGATNTTNATTSAVGTLNYIVSGSTNDLTDNLADTSAGTETATGTTEVAASFTTGTSGFTLNAATLLLDQATAGQATVAIDSDAGLQPGTLVATLTGPSTIATTLANTTFTAPTGVALTANTTYWVVLTAPSGSDNWSFTSDDTGTGIGFTDTWAESSDAGTTWFVYDSSPTQFNVTATAD